MHSIARLWRPGPTEFSARNAGNTQLILQHEAGVTTVADRLAGSYYIESLTAELAEKAWALIKKAEAYGRLTRAAVEGFPKRLIEEEAARHQADIDRGNDFIAGLRLSRRRWRHNDHRRGSAA